MRTLQSALILMYFLSSCLQHDATHVLPQELPKRHVKIRNTAGYKMGKSLGASRHAERLRHPVSILPYSNLTTDSPNSASPLKKICKNDQLLCDTTGIKDQINSGSQNGSYVISQSLVNLDKNHNDLSSNLRKRFIRDNSQQDVDIPLSRNRILDYPYTQPPDYNYERPNATAVRNALPLGEGAIPQYMLDLYRHYARNKSDQPHTDIVRSFVNIYDKNGASTDGSEYQARRRESIIQFAIQSVSRKEVIRQAELRIWCVLPVLPTSTPRAYWRLSIYRVKRSKRRRWRKKEIGSSLLYGSESMWVTFNVTDYLKFWHNRRHMSHIFVVRIRNTVGKTPRRSLPSVQLRGTRGPFLLVFSDPLHHKTKHIKAIPGPSGSELVPERSTREAFEEQRIPRADEIVKRSKRGRSRKNICRRKPLVVNFADLNWDTWIIAPKAYQAYECVGRCYFPLSDHLTPTRHAIVQTLLHTNYPDVTGRSCCVPTRLDPISMLFIDEQGAVTYTYSYEEMVVAECGCR